MTFSIRLSSRFTHLEKLICYYFLIFTSGASIKNFKNNKFIFSNICSEIIYLKIFVDNFFCKVNLFWNRISDFTQDVQLSATLLQLGIDFLPSALSSQSRSIISISGACINLCNIFIVIFQYVIYTSQSWNTFLLFYEEVASYIVLFLRDYCI